MTKLARIAVVAALLAGSVFVMATPASATEAKTVSDLLTSLKSQEFWKMIQTVGRMVGIAVVLLVASKQLFNAAKSGAGLMTAVPAIIVAFIVGGFLINLDGVMNIVAWGTNVASKGMDGIAALFK